jgi:hypothetical protein
MTDLVLPTFISDELFDALAEEVAQRVRERRRWADIDGVADYLGMPVRRARDLRERGMPAKRIGKHLVFDLREVDRWLEAQ